MAGELFEAGDVDSRGDPAPHRAAPQGVPRERRPVKSGVPSPTLDDRCDRGDVANPVTRSRWLSTWRPSRGEGGRQMRRKNVSRRHPQLSSACKLLGS